MQTFAAAAAAAYALAPPSRGGSSTPVQVPCKTQGCCVQLTANSEAIENRVRVACRVLYAAGLFRRVPRRTPVPPFHIAVRIRE